MKKEIYGHIYKITNKINNKVYIGQTISTFDKRYSYNVFKNTHNEHLKNSFKKYGKDNFLIEKKYDVAYNKEELDKKENYYIDLFDSTNPLYGYNKKEGGANGKLTEEAKLKMRNSWTQQRLNKLSKKMSKRVVCINDEKVFNSIDECSKFYELNRCEISKNLNNPYRINSSLNGFAFAYYDEFEIMELSEKEKRVFCIKGYEKYIKFNMLEIEKSPIHYKNFDWHDENHIKQLLFISKYHHYDINDDMYDLLLDLDEIIKKLSNLNNKNRYKVFSKKESEVLKFIRKECTIKEICYKLNCKRPVVSKMIKNIVYKIQEYTLDNFITEINYTI